MDGAPRSSRMDDGTRETARDVAGGGVIAARAAEAPDASDLLELTKPRITLLVVAVAAAGYLTGAGVAPAGTAGLLHALAGIALLAGGTNALNQVLEREADGRMRRTRGRPLPDGRVNVVHAGLFATLLVLGGTAYLAAAVNALTAALGLATAASYAFAYTPLKMKTSASTLVGAVSGALPALGGWTAATGRVGPGGLTLFAVLFLWQVPHVLALGRLHLDDYRRAGFRVPPVGDPGGVRSRLRSVAYATFLVPVSLSLWVPLGLAGPAYGAVAGLLGLVFVAQAARFALRGGEGGARRLFVTSLAYLPLLLVALVADGAVSGHAVSGALAGAWETVLAAPPHATLNAALNGAAAVALMLGLWFVKRGSLRRHRAAMAGAVASSGAFLVSYVVYHFRVGSVSYQGGGWSETLYHAVLGSHAVLAAAVVPAVAFTLHRALKGRRRGHRRLARWTYPVWLYVSLTGLVVYGMLYGG